MITVENPSLIKAFEVVSLLYIALTGRDNQRKLEQIIELITSLSQRNCPCLSMASGGSSPSNKGPLISDEVLISPEKSIPSASMAKLTLDDDINRENLQKTPSELSITLMSKKEPQKSRRGSRHSSPGSSRGHRGSISDLEKHKNRSDNGRDDYNLRSRSRGSRDQNKQNNRGNNKRKFQYPMRGEGYYKELLTKGLKEAAIHALLKFCKRELRGFVLITPLLAFAR